MNRIVLFPTVMIALAALSSEAHAQFRVHRAVGVDQTGPNDLCGEQVWTLGGLPPGPAYSGTFLGIEDTAVGSNTPIPITPTLCDPVMGLPDRLVATSYDDAFGAERGWIAPDSEMENLSLRRIPVNAGNGVLAPIPLPGSVPPNPLPPTIAAPADAVTVAKWLSADGDLEIVCDDTTGTASIAIAMSNLNPNGLYTLWAQWLDPLGELTPVPLGGLPNSIVADAQGQAEFCREVQFCPLDLAPDSSNLQFVSAMFMATDTFGAVPYEAFDTRAVLGIAPLPFLTTIPGGIVSFDQLGFRINATGGPDPGLMSPSMCQPPAVATVPSLSPTAVLLILSLLIAGGSLLVRRSVGSTH